MKTITVHASRTYNIHIGRGLLDHAGTYTECLSGVQKIAVVTDDQVDALYSARLLSSLSHGGYATCIFVIPHGEASKSAGNYIRLLNFLAENKLTRSDAIFALGGGVVGDLAGFAAATYQRGIRFVQVPTTLLAAVDSSVGGKTAIDLDAGKNLAGAFWQPSLVLCDCDTLRTLDAAIFRDGCAEVIKYGIIRDRVLFDKLRAPVQDQVDDIIARCVEIKRDIVCADEFDTGLRQILNFGHTVGHAIEACSHYTLSHGSAVAAGMVIISRAAMAMGICSPECFNAVHDMVLRYDLPDRSPYPAETLLAVMRSDKKRSGNTINLILPEQIGKCTIHTADIARLEDILKAGIV
jgi:3-dehydroquinate synthase